MTAPLDDDAPEASELQRSRITVELVALLIVLAGVVAVVCALAAFDWRLGLLGGGVAAVAGGVLLGSSTEGD